MLAALLVACGSVSGAGRAARPPARGTAEAVVVSRHAALLRFRAGRRSLSFRLREPAGVILLYRISAPVHVQVRGFVQVPAVTVPLRIATRRIGPSSSCTNDGARVVCTVGEEWCPMPAATWSFHVDKLNGPASEVRLSFRVGPPPSGVS
jgi:hypothetical protein